MRAFLVTLAVTTILGTSAAHAATATLSSSSGVVRYTAAAGTDVNDLSVSKTSSGSPLKYSFTDATGVAINASSPCTASGNTGSCPVTGVTRLNIDVKDGANSITLDAGIAIASTLIGGSGRDNFSGGSGDDTMYGRGGIDYLLGYDGADYLYGESGGDVLWGGPGNGDHLYGGPDNDGLDDGEFPAPLIYEHDGNNDYYDGGSGTDTWSAFQARRNGHATIVADGYSTFYSDLPGEPDDVNNFILNVEVLLGSPGDDIIFGNGSANVLYGLGGSDRLSGFGGPDVYRCDVGVGGQTPGFDTVDYHWHAPGNFRVSIGDGNNDGDNGGAERDDVEADCESVRGGSGTDTLIGNGEDNVLIGAGGNDTLIGNGGDDRLCGDAGNDTEIGDVMPGQQLEGGEGSDYVIGGAGDDVLHGNGGNDLVGGGIFTPPECAGAGQSGEPGRDTAIGWSGSDILATGSYDGPASAPEVAIGGTDADFYFDASPDSGPDLLLDGIPGWGLPESGNDFFFTTDGVADQIWCGFNDTGDTVVGDTDPAEQLLGGC